MDIEALKTKELTQIHRSRNRRGYLPNFLSLLFSIYFQSDKLDFDFRYYTVIFLMLLGTFIRVLMNEVLFLQWERKNVWARGINIFGFFCLALAWGIHFSDVLYHFGYNSTNVIYTLMIIIAFITGASTSMIADLASYYTFVSTLTLSVIVSYGLQPTFTHSFIVLNIFVYLIFSLSTQKISYKQLCELIESRLRAQHEKDRLDKFINTVPGFVGSVDRNLVCTMANKATLSFYPDIVGTKIGSLEPGATWEAFVIDFIHSSRQRDVSEQVTVRNGRSIHTLMNLQKLDDGGALVVSIVTTELVEARNRIREQEAQAQYTAKLVSLGEMAAGIAHEINNPLAIISGYSSMIKKLVQTDVIDKKNLYFVADKLIETADRISKTIKSLKTLSRNADKDPMVDVEIKTVVNDCMNMCHQRFKIHEVELTLPSEIDNYVVKGKEVQLGQVLLNLMNNAIDAVKKTNERWVEVKVIRDQKWLDILVIDSGPGIPKEIQDKIMNPFFTTKDVNEGTGLGLSISKSIMQSHNGELTLLDRAPHTTFRMRLPI